VEPGIYVASDVENVDPRFRGIGVRIEDDVVITAQGCENLTASIPKDPDDLEALVREGATRAGRDRTRPARAS